MKEETITVIDVETTGFSTNYYHRILEIGAVKTDLNGNIIDTFETLINPTRHFDNSDIHHITPEMVFFAPHFQDIAYELISFINGSYLVAHNAAFDRNFLLYEFERSQVNIPEMPFLCSMQLARTVYSNLTSWSLSNICRSLKIDHVEEHAALSDARATSLLLKLTMQKSLANNWLKHKV